MQSELLQECAEVTLELHIVQQTKLCQKTVFYASTLLLEKRNESFDLDKSYGFVTEQQFTLQGVLEEIAMYLTQCHVQ